MFINTYEFRPFRVFFWFLGFFWLLRTGMEDFYGIQKIQFVPSFPKKPSMCTVEC